MKKIILSILALRMFTPQLNGAFEESSTTFKASVSVYSLQLKLYEEQVHLAELKELLRLPEYQDRTSFDTQRLLNKIEESMNIIDYYNDCLVIYMYPKRSPESLKKEAQQNCLGPVKLVLHNDYYFHIPKFVKTKPATNTP